jgi:hypothetical protein
MDFSEHETAQPILERNAVEVHQQPDLEKIFFSVSSVSPW